MDWLEVALNVEPELAEAVAEVLGRFAPNGVIIESTAIENDHESEGYPVGPLRVTAYVIVDQEIEKTRQEIDRALWYLGRIKSIPSPEFKSLQESNWVEAWKKHYRPIPIGKQLIILPVWMDNPDDVRIPILINPGMAFGTGTHPSTQLCLQMLEKYVPVGGNVFDIGCGSGILSITAIKLGAQHAYGVDIDNESIKNANENAIANDVIHQADFTHGSVQEIRSGLFNIQQAPLVLANILAHILLQLLDHRLIDLVKPGGILILSGILEEQLPQIKSKIHESHLQILEQAKIDDWVALVLQR